ncbi:MAG: serine hydrolase [Bacteroidota bacterium]
MKSIYTLILFFLFCAPILWAQNPNPNPALDNFILDEMTAERLPGLSTVMVKDGEIVWLESYGMANFETNTPVSDSTIFLLASVSKLFTATAAMQLVEQGILDLDVSINEYLPFIVEHPTSFIPITARMLLTHTASIRDNFGAMNNYYAFGDPVLSLGEVIERYFNVNGEDFDANQNFYTAEPGTDYQYTNMGIALLGYLVEVLSESPFSDHTIENQFSPLCMNDTRWYLSELDTILVARPYTTQGTSYIPIAHYSFADYPNGLLRSSVLDLAQWMVTYLEEGQLGSVEMLSPNTIQSMWSPHISSIEPTQGLVWYQEELFLDNGGSAFLWGHNGGEAGTSTDIYFDPENNLALAILANGEGTNLFIADALYNYGLTLEATGTMELACVLSSAQTLDSAVDPVITLGPNPTDGWLHIRSKGFEGSVGKVFNALGQLVAEKEEIWSEWSIYLSAPGSYTVQIIAHGSQSWSKIVIRN